MKDRFFQKGFSLVEGLLLLVVIALVVAAGYFVFQRMDDGSSDESANNNTAQTEEAPDIKNAEDLDTASEQLEDINLDELDTSELEAIEEELL